MSRLETLQDRYASALRTHLTGREEVGLLEAYELGRTLMDDGHGLLDVVHFHDQALRILVDETDGSLPTHEATGFLNEVLAPYEMAYLGFQEANSSLQKLTQALEDQVASRTRELQDSLTRLQSSDAQRRRLLERVVGAQEQERHRIADDLHDDTIQVMTAAALRISIFRNQVDPAQHEALDRLEHTVMAATTRLRRLVFELRPPALDNEGLGAAIRMYLQTAFADGPVHTVDDRLEHQPPVPIREVAYRICQEALANVRKHANATRVHVQLVPNEDSIAIRIEDDGKGFDTARLGTVRPGHLGVTGMQERAHMIGGSIEIRSQPGRGTTVGIIVPDQDPAEA